MLRRIMAAVQADSEEPIRRSAPATLALALGRIWVRPRETMRQVVALGPQPRLEAALWTLGLASEQWGRGERRLALPDSTWGILALVAGAAVAILAALYVMGFLVRWTARLLGGRGAGPQVRAALAWGMTPHAWALLYRGPRLWLGAGPDQPLLRVDSGAGVFAIHWPTLTPLALTAQIAFGLLDAGVAIAGLVILSRCLGEVSGFSAWRGFGSWLLAIMIAAALVTAGVVAGVALFVGLAR